MNYLKIISVQLPCATYHSRWLTNGVFAEHWSWNMVQDMAEEMSFPPVAYVTWSYIGMVLNYMNHQGLLHQRHIPLTFNVALPMPISWHIQEQQSRMIVFETGSSLNFWQCTFYHLWYLCFCIDNAEVWSRGVVAKSHYLNHWSYSSSI